jgi:class 3 adenylate cyclase
MSAADWVGLIGGLIGILGALFAVFKFISSNQQLVHDKAQLETRLADVQAQNAELKNQMVVARRVGTAALAQKAAIDEALGQVMSAMQAAAASIFVPYVLHGGSGAAGLVFLSILPMGERASVLKRKLIPMQSLAGRCLTSGEPIARPDSAGDPNHYNKVDRVSGFQTEDTLSYPLRYNNRVIGVLQLLNREGGRRFDASDIPNVQLLADPLAVKVHEFLLDPANLDILGIAPDRDEEEATVMVCDLTCSRVLFQELNAGLAIQHLNEYLEKVCAIALRYGATVDKYMGDGVLLRFNVPHPVNDHPVAAMRCAMEMQSQFEKLKGDWIIMGEPLKNTFNRIAIANGQVVQAAIGHPQYQYLTILGQPVSLAANLCEIASREQSVIVIDERMYGLLGGRVRARKLPANELGKASAFSSAAYEVESFGDSVSVARGIV